MSKGWYILRSKPNKEDFLLGQVLAYQVEAYYPAVRARAVNPRARKYKPYFPGYLFVHVDLQQTPSSFWRWLPGARGLVAFGETPAPVPETLLGAIRRKVSQINEAGGEQLFGLKSGDVVFVQSGPFSDYSAIFDRCLSGNDRARVLIRSLQGAYLPVELPVEYIRKAKQAV